MREATPRLVVEGLSKRFGGLVAVKSLDFSLYGGEILGLIGPNGSGKSTAMQMVMGVVKPTAGRILLDGVDLAGRPTHRIARAGIGLVFQHARPLRLQTVLQNILLGLLPDSLTHLRPPPGALDRAREIAALCGLDKVLDRTPASLPFADLRRMEMAKVMARDPRVVLVDEPFAGLARDEVEDFANLIKAFRDQGRAVMLVDHNVKSIAALADRVSALYLGEKIAEGTPDHVMRDETVRRVYIGGTIETHERPEAEINAHQILLDVAGLSVFYGKAQALDDVSIRVHQGEFVSVVGLNGAGKTSLFNAMSGLIPYQGTISWDGEMRRKHDPAAIARAGLVQCAETRELLGTMSVADNLDLAAQRLAPAEQKSRQDWLFGLFPILQSRREQQARTLSGGEQQMLAIARALMMKPRLLILDEPTLGLAPVILAQLSDALRVLRETTDITLLLGEQNITFALPHADRVYLIEHGRLVWQGTPARFADEAGKNYL
ncbi:MAG TPA: ATP-binding cassette domain-containing protein [Acidiphilium sp.]|nr:MAG: ABC transporter ATP-binding protein [Acidiphilium sp. 21-60-14]OYV91788.1 MAG: ABC transporter ATP-binding protein [Acidiphilium sp. 37-60-79]OZB41309.1 MAG: ABC transporter ATP-binding protein [Acidiphilium sp. 34-60-192]HQT89245.1 ATP-binding cassette domain-containing protein [Acidiphilium sp.]HQU24288.1 ATP-binding cassette domain-containing protein [Acidiphilium sp.]